MATILPIWLDFSIVSQQITLNQIAAQKYRSKRRTRHHLVDLCVDGPYHPVKLLAFKNLNELYPMRMIISFAALFMSVILLQLSSGGVGPLDALSGLKLGFTTAQVGFLGSAHFNITCSKAWSALNLKHPEL